MKIWCAAEEGKRRYRPFWMLAGGFGLLLLCMLIAAGSAILALYSRYGAWVSLGGCVLAVAVGVALASRLGTWSAEGNTLFWLDDEDRLFALDTRDGAPDGRGFYALLAQEKAAARRMRKARQQLEAGQDPGGVELLAVLRVTLRRRGRTVRCSVRYPNGGTGEQSFFLPDRMDGAEELLNILGADEPLAGRDSGFGVCPCRFHPPVRLQSPGRGAASGWDLLPVPRRRVYRLLCARLCAS